MKGTSFECEPIRLRCRNVFTFAVVLFGQIPIRGCSKILCCFPIGNSTLKNFNKLRFTHPCHQASLGTVDES